MALGACGGSEAAPFYQRSTTDDEESTDAGRWPDGGQRPSRGSVIDDDGAGAGAGSKPDAPGAPELKNCGTFDPDAVHLVGVGGDTAVNEQGSPAGIVNELTHLCPSSSGWMIAPTIRPEDGQVLYVGGVGARPEGESRGRVVRQFAADIPALVEDPVIETMECADKGISLAYPDATGEGVIYNCIRPASACGVFIHALSHPWWACYGGPYFDQDGAVVPVWKSAGNDGSVFAVNGKGEYLVGHSQGFEGLGIWTRSTDSVVPAVFDEDTGSLHPVVRRGHAEGFWVVLQPVAGKEDRSLYLVRSDGSVERQGTYPDAPSWGWSWALDASGNLYEDLGDEVIRSTLDGEQDVVYAPPPRDPDSFMLHGGYSAFLITGAW